MTRLEHYRWPKRAVAFHRIASHSYNAQANSMMINMVVVAWSSRTRTGGGRFFGSHRCNAFLLSCHEQQHGDRVVTPLPLLTGATSS
jgi:hypothetical protein